MIFALDPAPKASTSDPNEFTAVTGADARENFNGSTLLVEAYAAIWLVLMAWILILWRKQASMSERLDDLERTLDRAAAAAEKKAKAKAS
jgi:CcmD family protein